MQITIELRPQIETKQTPLGPVENPIGQSMVLASTGHTTKPIHVVYIGDKPGSNFLGLHEFRKYPPAIRDAVVKAVEAKMIEDGKWPAKTKVESVAVPPPPLTPNQLDTLRKKRGA